MEIADIKSQLTLSQVLQHYGLKPDKHLRLNCPFHEDKTPSLQVYYKTHTAYCFSSNCRTHGKSLDVIDFVMYKESLTKHEAIEKCVQLLGGTLPKPPAVEQLTRTAVLTKMFTYFKNGVHNSKPAQEYLKARGLDHGRLEIGYNSGQFHHGDRRDEALIRSCVEVGLLSLHDRPGRTGEASYRPFAKYAIVFALRSRTGQVAGLYFRSTVNDQEQRHFYLRDSTGLYPRYPHPDSERLILTESIIDAASLLQIRAVTEQYTLLAAYGTNRLTEEMRSAIAELRLLKEIIFAFDSDEAGNKAAAKYKEELKAMLPQVRFSKLVLPCKDVNETLTAHNEEVFIQLLSERTEDFSFSPAAGHGSTEPPGKPAAELFTDAKSEQPLPLELKGSGPEASVKEDRDSEPQQTPQQESPHQLDTSNPYRIRYSSETAHYYVQGALPKTTDNLRVMLVIENKETTLKARNRIDLYEDKQVERLCREVSEKLSLRKDLLETDLYRLTGLLECHIEVLLQQNSRPKEHPLPILTLKERQPLEAFAKGPKLVKRLNELLAATGIVGEERSRIFLFLIALSHKMPETLHALIQGSSGSGKTRLLRQISDCMPPESVTRLTRLSDKVLYNYPEHYFQNRLLCLEDIDGLSEEAEFAFRELQSNGELNSATSIKLENGQITSGQKTVRGPIASLACTTRGEVYEDNMSRVFLVAVDESAEQTGRIIEYQNRKAAGLIEGKKEGEIKTFLQNFVRILQPLEVVNPFAACVHLPPEAHKIRRLNDLFQSFVRMVTLVHQYQRKRDEKGRLVTEVEDLETAVHIMFESIVLKVDELDGSLRQFYEQLKTFMEKKGRSYEFTRFELRAATGVGRTQQHHYINQLVSLEYVQQNGFANRGFKYRIVHWDDHAALRQRIKTHLSVQLEAIKAEHHRMPGRTPEPATVAG